MANLLPLPEQKKVWSMYRGRIILCAAYGIIVVSIFGGLALVPSYHMLTQVSETQPPTQSTTAPADSSDSSISNTRALLETFSTTISATTTPSVLFELVLHDIVPGIKIDHLQFSLGSPSSLLVGGTASTREAIDAYQKALAKETLFTSVVVPVAAFVAQDKGRFTATISGPF